MRLRISAEGQASVKRFVTEMATITCGILIALALEHVVREWYEGREAREAAASIESEMRDNRAELQRMLPGRAAKAREEIEAAVAMVDAEIAFRDSGRSGEMPVEPRYHLTMPVVTINNTNHATAQATGALAHMPDAQVRRFAKVYNYQAQFTRQYEQLADHYVRMLPLDKRKLSQQPTAEIERWRLSLLTALQCLYQVEQMGRALVGLYDRHLESR